MIEAQGLCRSLKPDLKRWASAFVSSHRTLFAVLWIAVFGSVFLWQRSVPGGFIFGWRGDSLAAAVPLQSIPRLRAAVFNLTDFGAVGDGVSLNTEAFERAVAAIGKLGRRGGGQLNVPPGRWLTAPFNLTSHMTLFLAEGAVILGIEVKFPLPFIYIYILSGCCLLNRLLLKALPIVEESCACLVQRLDIMRCWISWSCWEKKRINTFCLRKFISCNPQKKCIWRYILDSIFGLIQSKKCIFWFDWEGMKCCKATDTLHC